MENIQVKGQNKYFSYMQRLIKFTAMNTEKNRGCTLANQVMTPKKGKWQEKLEKNNFIK